MSIALYCFSATGNSLSTARMLAQRLGDCRLISAAALRRSDRIIEESDAVGFVFPVYFSDMPCIVRELISKMVFREDAYLFIVPTCRGHEGAVNQRVDQLLRTRGRRLHLSTVIRMPGNSYINEPGVDDMHLQDQANAVRLAAEQIASRESNDYFSSELLPFVKTAYPNNFRGITADDSCIGCGLCAQLCPMGNISVSDGRAVIGDMCATCLTCFHWCPREAVWMSRQENIARRSKYHHPDVTLADIEALMTGKETT